MNKAALDDAGFHDAVAIVTGGGAQAAGIGNGRAAAVLLGRAGVKVVVADSVMARAEDTVRMLAAEGGAAIAVEVDVSNEIQCRELVNLTLKTFGRLDFLDNNVGVVAPKKNVVDLESEEWRRVMRVNLDSMFYMSKYAIKAMIATAEGGAIVNIGSVASLRPAGQVAYSTAKGAVVSLTRAMAVDHGRDGIRVNCVVPGAIFTPMVVASAPTGQSNMEERERKRQFSVLGVEGDAWDTAFAVRFLLSRYARFITGQTLVVDGGTTLPDSRMKREPIPLNNLSR